MALQALSDAMSRVASDAQLSDSATEIPPEQRRAAQAHGRQQISSPESLIADTRILGINFFAGDIRGLVELTKHGGLVAVPSAPVLVDLGKDEAHRAAVEGCDFAITDSGFMVWLWWLFGRGKLERISGLKFIRALMEDRDFREPGAVFWVMPSGDDAFANMAWLQRKGLKVRQADMYVAPMYPKTGPIVDAELAQRVREHGARFVVLCLGGGVQERLGYFLRRALRGNSAPVEVGSLGLRAAGAPERGRSGSNAEHTAASGNADLVTGHGSLVTAGAATRLPAIICTGAAIAFLSGRQANIPPWADRMILGWLFRCLSEPTKFLPRYWRSMKLIGILWKYGESSVAEDPKRFT